MQNHSFRGRAVLAAVVVSLSLASGVRGQDDGVPPPEAEPASIEEFEAAQAQVEAGGPGGARRRWVVPGGGVYYSPTLRGHFRAQWLFIRQNGRQITFWGARIVHLDADSPVRQIGLSPGDVITRLDGIPVARGMYREGGGPWQIVQMEQHFGRTEVRYILRGTNHVAIGDMMLDGVFPGDGENPFPIPP